jgi:hypothetical protein
VQLEHGDVRRQRRLELAAALQDDHERLEPPPVETVGQSYELGLRAAQLQVADDQRDRARAVRFSQSRGRSQITAD